jgi:phage gp29-like protein
MEINYKPLTSGRFAGKVGLQSIKSKDPSAFGFDMDEYLNIKGFTMLSAGGEMQLPLDKFIIYTYMPSYEMPYGQSDLRAAYKHWFCKDIITKFWNLHLEKFGMPTAQGRYKRGMPKDQQDELLRALDKIQQETAIVIPEDVTIELLEAKRDGEAGYLRAIEFHNRQIAKAILGQTLTSDEGSHSGSFAMAKVHMDILGHYLRKIKRDIEETVMRDQLIRRLVDINYPNGAYPRFTLGCMDDRDPAVMGVFIEKLIGCGVVSPDEAWIREYIGVPSG